MSDNQSWTTEDAERAYGIKRWGAGYFSVNEKGNLQVTPDLNNKDMRIDVKSVVEEIKQEGVQFPVVVRFHDILRSQVVNLNTIFAQTIAEAQFNGQYRGVYPVKVNQMREVVEEIVDVGNEFNYGLEAGSKAELIAALAYNTNPDALTILNGYKDEEVMQLAMLGRTLGRQVIVVIEKYSELISLVRIARQYDIKPIVGVRAKLTVKGQGKWEGSGGDRAKFGLTIAEIINTARFLESEGLIDSLKLLHFHIGSQLTDIRVVKEAINEATCIYAELYKMGFPLEYIDIGGGLGIDYDGTKSTSDSSRNYSMAEYIADVVYGVKEVCDLEEVPHPNLVSESGRAITAHHSCVITEIVGEIKPSGIQFQTEPSENEHILVKNIRELTETIDEHENLQEVYNDAEGWKEQALNAFKLRVVTLEELAKVETFYWQILHQLQKRLKSMEFIPEDLQELGYNLSSQYLCNFSVFQSAADTWAIDQVLPVAPISRMHEEPTVNCSLVDITCDSDGKIDQFVSTQGIQDVIPLHQLETDEKYYLGLFLTGAYQDVMGDMHNLFGRLNEVHIFSYDDDPQDFYIEEVVNGSRVSDVLNIMQYNSDWMAQHMKKLIDQQVSQKKLNPRDGVKWTDFYESCLKGYTYLKTDKS